jgi:hypothetical protein
MNLKSFSVQLFTYLLHQSANWELPLIIVLRGGKHPAQKISKPLAAEI